MANMKPARSRSGYVAAQGASCQGCRRCNHLAPSFLGLVGAPVSDVVVACVAGRSDEDDAFGWQLFHDRQRNLVYYLHSYTGEVRWPRPETVGFVMHGLKPLPVHAGADARTDTSIVNPDIWSPYYPHVVMLPSGLVQVHPGPDADAQGATEMWCGYNRFPLRGYGARPAEQHSAHGFSGAATMSSGPRVLPPTWEDSRSGSPFLPPYPVAVLDRDDAEDERRLAPRPPLQRLDERFQTPETDLPRSHQQLRSGELGRVQGSMDWSTTLCPTSTNVTTSTDRKQPQPAYPKGFPAPNTEKKEHNRKGYLLRQARKTMRESGSSSAPATAAPADTPVVPNKQHKVQAVPLAAKTRHELSRRKLEDKQDNFTAVCRLAAVQTREKVTVPAAGGVRRRRLKPKMPKDKFAALSTEFLDRVQSAMEPLHPPVNDEFQLQRDDNGELVIRTNAKEFVVKVLSSKQQIEFSSPVSGLRTYQWNAMTKRWEDEVDSHDIEGLLTRDLMRFCAGIPLF
ncbi:hypothetical protein PHYPSEUDO_006551 [Phytophthora pseudosyringae]|uniref:WW domain-containing protein n=1 Tax=Phytophthora pseudosyringae TaxID=221518 RepID=A0A8T1VLB4_9STRA|nr:hypothetical protein PHYPSEUDO_006551 [Phytophthora pseudosyringae]